MSKKAAPHGNPTDPYWIFFPLGVLLGIAGVLSHGGHPLAQEQRSWPLRIGITAVLIAMFARLGAPLAPNSYFSHLSWGGAFWITGILIWGSFILRRIQTVPR